MFFFLCFSLSLSNLKNMLVILSSFEKHSRVQFEELITNKRNQRYDIDWSFFFRCFFLWQYPIFIMPSIWKQDQKPRVVSAMTFKDKANRKSLLCNEIFCFYNQNRKLKKTFCSFFIFASHNWAVLLHVLNILCFVCFFCFSFKIKEICLDFRSFEQNGWYATKFDWN
jgi:hypothetical protein